MDLRHITLEDVLNDVKSQGGFDHARQMYQESWTAKSNRLSAPWSGNIPPVGTWRCDDLGELEILVEIPLDLIFVGELDNDQWFGFSTYVEWAKQGYAPPPPTVVRQTSGRLISMNSRRVMAAKRAGVKTMKAWLSESTERGFPLWRLPRNKSNDIIWPS